MGRLSGLEFPGQPVNEMWILRPQEKLFLDINLFGLVESWILYRLIVEPNVTDHRAKQRCSSLLNSLDVKEYMGIRVKQVESAIWRKAGDEDEEEDNELPKDVNKVVLLEAWRKIKNSNFSGDSEEWKLFLKKVLSDMEKNVALEPPRRYLAETCGECRYKHYCEENTEDECLFCKYRDFALKNGSEEYEYKNQLNKK